MGPDYRAILTRLLVPPDGDLHAEIDRAYKEGWVTEEFLRFVEQGAVGKIQGSDYPPELLEVLVDCVRNPQKKEAHDLISSHLVALAKHRVACGKINHHAVLARLLLPPDRDLHAEIMRTDRQGWLTPAFRRFLERGAIGEVPDAACLPTVFSYLLGEILDVRFIPPDIPSNLRMFYETKIGKALEPPSIQAAKDLLDEMESEGLLNRDFLEFFGNELNKRRGQISQLLASSIWEMVVDRAEKNL